MVGFKDEHEAFCSDFAVDIPHIPTPTIAELAAIIAGADLFIGNQSMPYAIAEGIGKYTIQEVYLAAPNCIFDRPDAVYFRAGALALPPLRI